MLKDVLAKCPGVTELTGNGGTDPSLKCQQLSGASLL